MKKHSIILLLFFSLLFSFTIQAQRVEFTYDEAGNRISGKTISMLRADTGQETPSEDMTSFSEILAEHEIRIYPNPTKGLLKVEVDNLQDTKKVSLRLYGMGGNVVITRDGVASPVELDITSQPDGIYILRIVIGEHESEWKIIKH
ncbi:T9SS type A sorting domain-containing protein [Bacteroidales bacterium OttesenSCG-928-M06]|nr:T9SS type A sorting domain-containing protein [Bacteroidales bacterium OttesenSCG-928-M06]